MSLQTIGGNGSTTVLWHKSAPHPVRRATALGDETASWTAWREHLARRETPVEPAGLLREKQWPLHWGLPSVLRAELAPAWRSLAVQRPRPAAAVTPPEVIAWLHASAEGAADLAHALQAVACAEAMPRLAGVLPAAVWHDLLTRLLALANDARAIVLEDDPLPHQLLAGELPLTLAYLFPEIEFCRRMKPAAREALSSGLSDLLDGEGMPHARHLALLRPLLACWTRCLALGQAIKGGCCTAAAQNQYRWLVGHALRLTRYDGTHVLTDDSPAEADRSLLDAALRLGGDRGDRAIAALALAQRGRSRREQGDEARLPAPVAHSEWACVAVMRRCWSRSGPCVTVLYDNRVLRTELRCGKDVLWSGEWGLDVRLNGRLVEPVGEWEETCWVSDEDVDFLELEMELAGGLRVQRHLAFARDDRFLLLADAVLGSPSGRIEYQGRLPLAPGVAFRGAEETREGYLVGGKRRALVMPLALPEWRTDRRFGELVWTIDGLELHQSAEGRGLYAPLLLDLDPHRMTRRLTWRQLTVAESLAAQPRDVAVGYRVAVGKQQWLIYRSLAEAANRTLLGHNLSSELLVARFDPSGEVEALVEVE